MCWKCEFFMDNLINNDEFVKFYIEFLILICLMIIINMLKFLVEELKYRDSNKGNKVNF